MYKIIIYILTIGYKILSGLYIGEQRYEKRKKYFNDHYE